MLIVSKFHDYYDTASIYGIDKTCVYNRKEEKLDINGMGWNSTESIMLPGEKKLSLPRSLSGDQIGVDYRFFHRIIGFCGKYYPMILVEKIENYGHTSSFYLYSKEEVREFLAKEGIKIDNPKRYWYYRSNYNVRTEQGLFNYFDVDGLQKMDEIFHAFRSPVFVLGHRRVTVNPSLKDLGFMKVKDPQTAFQEIYMYMSGVIGAPPKQTKPIDDKTMAASKGHDGIYSFKKPPGGKRWR